GLGMQVIAEGIEELYQLHFLQDMNCDIGQGYYFSRPIPAEDLQLLLKRGYFDLS
ncbi:MAG: EAL domain-containing protein, partial [Clostridiaceae bacterium]|nr:EAL domain-containing protein [Clostridiaceae bacterium]